MTTIELSREMLAMAKRRAQELGRHAGLRLWLEVERAECSMLDIVEPVVARKPSDA